MIKNILPKSPIAAAGVGLLVGAGVAGIKGWRDVKRGEATRQEAVFGVVKQSLLFGGIAALSTVGGGNKSGGAGLATMAVLGLTGGGSMPSMLLGTNSGRGGMRGAKGSGMSSGGQRSTNTAGVKRQGNSADGDASVSILDSVSQAVADYILPDSPDDLVIEKDSSKDTLLIKEEG